MEYDSVVEEIAPFVTAWMGLEDVAKWNKQSERHSAALIRGIFLKKLTS